MEMFHKSKYLVDLKGFKIKLNNRPAILCTLICPCVWQYETLQSESCFSNSFPNRKIRKHGWLSEKISFSTFWETIYCRRKNIKIAYISVFIHSIYFFPLHEQFKEALHSRCHTEKTISYSLIIFKCLRNETYKLLLLSAYGTLVHETIWKRRYTSSEIPYIVPHTIS